MHKPAPENPPVTTPKANGMETNKSEDLFQRYIFILKFLANILDSL